MLCHGFGYRPVLQCHPRRRICVTWHGDHDRWLAYSTWLKLIRSLGSRVSLSPSHSPFSLSLSLHLSLLFLSEISQQCYYTTSWFVCVVHFRNRWGNGNREPEIILHYSNALPTSMSYFISIYFVTRDQKLSGICMSISCRIEAPSHPPPCFHN